MYDYDRFVVFCDSIFKSINQQHITKLIIDLRENGGGNSALGRYLLDYVTNTPYRMAGNSERKVSAQFKEFINKPENKPIYGNDYDEYLKMQIGTYWQVGNDELWKPASHVNKFKGKVCFLIGPYTFSSANMLSATIKDFKLATLIGEPTGEAGNDYGELCNIELPQTGWIAFTSTTAWVRPNNDKTNPNPIFPDYLVEKSQSNEDNVLKFAMKWLNK